MILFSLFGFALSANLHKYNGKKLSHALSMGTVDILGSSFGYMTFLRALAYISSPDMH